MTESPYERAREAAQQEVDRLRTPGYLRSEGAASLLAARAISLSILTLAEALRPQPAHVNVEVTPEAVDAMSVQVDPERMRERLRREVEEAMAEVFSTRDREAGQ